MKSMYTYLDLDDELQELTEEEKNWFFTTCQDLSLIHILEGYGGWRNTMSA